jgi:hypothetical protein
MRGLIENKITPQQKMVAVNQKFGNTNIKNQQGTTRTIYHSLPLDNRTTFRFFENAQASSFPLTNIGSEGNRLEVGSTFTLQKIYLVGIFYDAVNNTIIGAGAISSGLANDFSVPFATGEIDFQIANSQVVKQLPTHWDFSANFNPQAVNTSDIAFEFATDIVIPPLLEYVCQLRTTSYDKTADPSGYTHIMCVIQGSAGIIAPQTTF